MEEVREALGILYAEYGHNDVTISLSKYLDQLIIKKQMEEFEKWKALNKLQMKKI